MGRPWVFPAILLVFSFFVIPDHAHSRDGAERVRPVQVRQISDGPTSRYYIQADGVDEREVVVLRKRLISEGAEKVNLFLPWKIIVCEAPEGLDVNAVVGDPRFAVTSEASMDLRPAARYAEPSGLDVVREAYQRALEPPFSPVAGPGGIPDAGLDDVLRILPPEIVEISRVRAAASVAPDGFSERTIQQNSEFLAGDVLCQIVCPESDGHAEDWTDRMLADAASGAYAALLDFQAKFSHASLNYIVTTQYRVPTAYEPITTTMDEHWMWIVEVMHQLGVPTDRSMELMVHEYNNRGRRYYGTDWAFTAFVANSANDDDHRFADKFYTAYALLGGPYLVMPLPAGENPFEIDPWLVFSTVFQHEMGHVFWALDEYPGPNNMATCVSHTGYLDYLNMNKVEEVEPGVYLGCPGREPQVCVMWRAKEDHGRPICPFTQGQIGVIDANQNSVPDVFDASPTVVFADAEEETIYTPDVTVALRVVSDAVRNVNPFQSPAERVSYAAPIKDAYYTIDGFGTMYVNPDDGKWDEIEEDLSISVRGIPVGLTKVGVSARNAYGKSSGMAFKSIYFPGIRFALFGADPFNDGNRNVIRVSWNTVGEIFGAVFDLYRIDTYAGTADTTLCAENVGCRLEPGGRFRYFQYDDTNVVPGRSYSYFVKSYFEIERDGHTLEYRVTSETFGTQSGYPIPAGQIVSQASPNPFAEKTNISIRVPNPALTANGVSSADDPQSGTPVIVTIYDVAGRRVRTVYNGRTVDALKTIEWDGANDAGERVPSGLYFIRTEAGGGVDVKKVVVLR